MSKLGTPSSVRGSCSALRKSGSSSTTHRRNASQGWARSKSIEGCLGRVRARTRSQGRHGHGVRGPDDFRAEHARARRSCGSGCSVLSSSLTSCTQSTWRFLVRTTYPRITRQRVNVVARSPTAAFSSSAGLLLRGLEIHREVGSVIWPGLRAGARRSLREASAHDELCSTSSKRCVSPEKQERRTVCTDSARHRGNRVTGAELAKRGVGRRDVRGSRDDRRAGQEPCAERAELVL
jgi:hypothetical protein